MPWIPHNLHSMTLGKAKVESAVGHAQKTPLKGQRFESLEEAQAYLDRWESAGPTLAFTEPPSGKSQPCSRKRNRRCCRCRSSLSAITNTASGPCIWMAASKSRPLTMARLRAGSAAGFRCSGMPRMCGCSIRSPGNCCASTCGNSAAVTASKMKIVRGGHRYRRNSCCAAPRIAGQHIGALCQAMHRKHGEVAVRRILGVLALAKKYGVASTDDACALALETGASEYHFVRRYLEHNPQLPLSLRQVDPLIRQLTLYRDLIESRTQDQGEPIMNLIELERALANSGWAAWPRCSKPACARLKPKPWRPST